MNCPRCKSQLIKDVINEVTIEFDIFKCKSCGGIWFEKNEDFIKIEKITEPLLVEFRNIPSRETQMEPLTCPSCNNLQYMNKVENTRDHKVIIDVCSVCEGVWLDKGELEAIQKESFMSLLSRFYRWMKK